MGDNDKITDHFTFVFYILFYFEYKNIVLGLVLSFFFLFVFVGRVQTNFKGAYGLGVWEVGRCSTC